MSQSESESETEDEIPKFRQLVSKMTKQSKSSSPKNKNNYEIMKNQFYESITNKLKEPEEKNPPFPVEGSKENINESRENSKVKIYDNSNIVKCLDAYNLLDENAIHNKSKDLIYSESNCNLNEGRYLSINSLSSCSYERIPLDKKEENEKPLDRLKSFKNYSLESLEESENRVRDFGQGSMSEDEHLLSLPTKFDLPEITKALLKEDEKVSNDNSKESKNELFSLDGYLKSRDSSEFRQI